MYLTNASDLKHSLNVYSCMTISPIKLGINKKQLSNSDSSQESTMRLKQWAVLASVIAVVATVAPYSYAIPPFSRLYGTSCSTCHIDFPQLNSFGKAFKDAGFKFPKNDEDFIKIPPVMLGAPAQKEMWPKAIYPGTLPGIPQLGLRFNTFFQVYSENRNKFAPPAPGRPSPPPP